MLHNILYICLIKRIQQIKNAVFTLYNNLNNKEEFTAWSYDEKIKNSEKHVFFMIRQLQWIIMQFTTFIGYIIINLFSKTIQKFNTFYK